MSVISFDRASANDGDEIVHDLHFDSGVMRQVYILIPQLCSGHWEGLEVDVHGEVFTFRHSNVFDAIHVQLGLIGLFANGYVRSSPKK